MKFATYHLMANVGRMILQTIKNSGKFVDKIYVAYSPHLWKYKKHGLVNNDNPGILKESEFYDKITLVEGTWDLDEDQRNAVMKQAQLDGIDYLITQDVDEFYPDFSKSIIQGISESKNFDYYLCNSHILWKNGWTCCNEEGVPVDQKMEVAINLHTPGIHFRRCRRPLGSFPLKARVLPGKFYHGAYIREPEQMWHKLNSWGHAHQIKNAKDWYENIWLNWTPDKRQLHYSRTGPVNQAKKIELPQNIKEILNALGIDDS